MKRFLTIHRRLFWAAALAVCLLAGLHTAFRRPDPRRLVEERQTALEQIAAYAQSFGQPRVAITSEGICTYTALTWIPAGQYGQYALGEEGPDFETDPALVRFMRRCGIDRITYSEYGESKLTVFLYDGQIQGVYHIDPDQPSEKAYTSCHPLTPAGEGWEYREFGRRYYTEKLCKGWYYYEVTS